jgi:serine protease Do
MMLALRVTSLTHAWVYMNRAHGRALVVGVLMLLIGPALGVAESPDHRSPSGIQQAKRATLGVLQPGEDAQRQGGKAHFVMRGTALHLRDGYLLTARHVAEQDEAGRRALAKQITVLTADLDEVPATFVGMNAFLDLAVYRLPHDMSGRLPNVSVAPSDPEPGEEVFTIGYPLGWGPAIAFGRNGNPSTFLPTVDTRLFQIDLSVCAGNSGGGLFNARGELIGIMHAMIQTTSERGEQPCSPLAFASPGPLVHRVASALIHGEQPSFSKLGTALTAVRMGTRWRVAVAEANGPAREGGVQKGDVLLAIDNTDIADGAQLKNYLIERTAPGQQIALRVLREGQERVLHVTLGKS